MFLVKVEITALFKAQRQLLFNRYAKKLVAGMLEDVADLLIITARFDFLSVLFIIDDRSLVCRQVCNSFKQCGLPGCRVSSQQCRLIFEK